MITIYVIGLTGMGALTVLTVYDPLSTPFQIGLLITR
jgi:hypothetical protein